MLKDKLNDRQLKSINDLNKKKKFDRIVASSIKTKSKIIIKGDWSRIEVKPINLKHPDTDYFLFKGFYIKELTLKDNYVLKDEVCDLYLPFKSIFIAFQRKNINVLELELNVCELEIIKKTKDKYEIMNLNEFENEI
jgi:hypothetical protein